MCDADIGGYNGEIVKDTGVYSIYNISSYQNQTKYLWTAGFYSTDPAVQSIRVTANGKEETLILNDKHFAAFQIGNTENDGDEKGANEILTDGEALDQNGNLLYRMRIVERSVPYSNPYYEIEWVKAN